MPKALLLRAVGLWLLLVLVLTRGRAAGPPPLRRDGIAMGVLLLLVSAGVSTAVGLSPLQSLLGHADRLDGLGTLAALGLVFFATRAYVAGPSDGWLLVWATAAATAGATALCGVQVLDLDPIPWRGAAAARAGFATFGNAGFAGGFLAATSPLCAALAFRTRERGAPLVAVGLAGLAAASAMAAIATLTRAAWLSLGAGYLILAIAWWRLGDRRPLRTLLVGGVAVAIATGTLAWTTSLGDHLQERIALTLSRPPPRATVLWQAAALAVRERPLLGSGPATFELAFTPLAGEVEPVARGKVPKHAHNEVWNLAVTQGVVGLGALGLLVFGVARDARELLKQGPRDRQALVAALCASLISTALFLQLWFLFVPLGVLCAVSAGMISGLRSRPEAGDPVPYSPAPPICFAAVLAAASFAASALREGSDAAPAALAVAAIGLPALVVGLVARRIEGAPASTERVPPGQVERLAWVAGASLASAAAVYLVVFPMRAELHAREGLERISQGDFRGAIAPLRKAVERTPYHERYWLRLGEAYHLGSLRVTDSGARRAQLHLARQAFERAVALVPARARNHGNLARVLGDLALHGERVEPQAVHARFARALALAPTDGDLLGEAGLAALLLGDVELADEYATRAEARFPGRKDLLALRGTIELQRGDLEAAGAALEEATAGDWRDRRALARALVNLARVHIEQGRYDEAIGHADRALEVRPDYAYAFQHRGRAREAAGDLAGAQEDYRRAIALAPMPPREGAPRTPARPP